MKREEIDVILRKHKNYLNADSRNPAVKADFSRLDLNGVNFSGADLRYADLSQADLSGAIFCYANLAGANLAGANLFRADLSHANLCRANFVSANMLLSNLSCVCTNSNTSGLFLTCPEEGAFVGWKKALQEKTGLPCIIKLLVLEDAKRSSATTRKCRCSKAKVLEIQDTEGNEIKRAVACSSWDNNFIYKKGRVITPDDFDEDRWNECSNGIHFFITRREAVEY